MKLAHILLSFCLFTTFCLAQQPNAPVAQPAQPAQPAQIEPKLKDFEQAYVSAQKFVNEVGSEEYINKMFSNTEIKFSELPDEQKKLLILYSSDRLDLSLTNLQKAWKLEEVKAMAKGDAPTPDLKTNDRPALLKEVQEHSSKLFELRKKHAAAYEALMDKTLKELEDILPENERVKFSKEIRNRHDLEKLVERK